MKKIIYLGIIIFSGCCMNCYSNPPTQNNAYNKLVNNMAGKPIQNTKLQNNNASQNKSLSSQSEINQLSKTAENMRLCIDSIENNINKAFHGKNISEFYKNTSKPFLENLRKNCNNFMKLLANKTIKDDLYKYQLIFTTMEDECNKYVKQCKERYLNNGSTLFQGTHYFAYNKTALTQLCDTIEKSYVPNLKRQFGDFVRKYYGFSFAGF